MAGRSISVLPWLGLGVALAALFAAHLAHPPFTADSWTFFELARTFGRDFYEVRTWRSFDVSIPYSKAFPPAWPAVIAAVHHLTGLGVYSGYVGAFGAYLGFAYAAERVAAQADVKRVGLLSAVLLLAFPPLREELVAGRSMPLFLLLLASSAYVLSSWRLPPTVRGSVVGLLAGLMVMTRFDALVVAGVLLLALCFTTREQRPVTLFSGALTFAATVSPWVAYSLTTFGQWFATDNARVAASIQPIFVLDYFTDPPRTIADDPVAWLSKVAWNVPLFLVAVGEAFAKSVFVVPLAAMVAVLARRSGGATHDDRAPKPRVSAALRVLPAACAFGLVAQLTTGYFDLRYFSPLIWSICLACMVRLAPSARPFATDRAVSVLALVVSIVLGTYVALAVHRSPPRSHDGLSRATLLECLTKAGASSDDTILFFRVPPYEFGALTGWRTSPTPTNWSKLNTDAREQFLTQYGIRYVVAALPESLATIAGERLDGCPIPFARLGPLEKGPSTEAARMSFAPANAMTQRW